MNIRYYVDPETDEPHIYNHQLDEQEVEDILRNRIEDRVSRGTTRSAIGQTQEGRYIRVIYSQDPDPDGIFVITAYELSGRLLKAYRRRKRRRG